MELQELRTGPVTCLVGTPRAPAAAVLIVLHGYAMDAGELAPLVCALGLPAILYFPRGPHAAQAGGYCWWQLDEQRRRESIAHGPRDLRDEHPADRAQARAALLAVAGHARGLHPGLPLVIVGFSQGGMLACDTLLLEELEVQGLILLSSSCIAMDEWRPQLQRLQGLPVLVSHGRRDHDLAFAAGEGLRDALRAGGADVAWLAFDGGHEVPFAVWRTIRKMVLHISHHNSGASSTLEKS